MGFLDFIINVNDAFDSFRNFSCRSQNLDGFLRCYRHAKGNECYDGDSTNAIMASRSGCEKSCSPPTMQKRTLGQKEYCSECGAELYELFHDPNNNRICPKCGNKEYYWDFNL